MFRIARSLRIARIHSDAQDLAEADWKAREIEACKLLQGHREPTQVRGSVERPPLAARAPTVQASNWKALGGL